MKTLTLVIVSAAALSGCAVYPAYGPPGGVYAVPAPVAIYPSYGYAYGPRYGGYGYGPRFGGYGYRYGGYGYRGWH